MATLLFAHALHNTAHTTEIANTTYTTHTSQWPVERLTLAAANFCFFYYNIVSLFMSLAGYM